MWRNTFSNAKQKSFSRVKLIITRLRSIFEDNDNKCISEDMLTYFDGWYLNSKNSFSVVHFGNKLKKFLDGGVCDPLAPWNM